MAKGEVRTLFACMVCGRGWASKQSLRAHMKVHKGEDIRSTHIVVKGQVWDRFVDLCRRHHTTTCHLLDVLMRAALKGDETGMIDVGAPNPAVIQIHEYFMGRPRSPFKVEVPAPEGLIVSGEGAGSNSAGVTLKGSDFGGVRGCRRRGLPPPDPEWMKRQLEIT